MPASSRVSQAVSSSSRCCGSIAGRLARADAEEAGVELGGVVEEAALARVGGAGVVGVGVVEGVEVPAAVGGEAAVIASRAVGDQLPEASRGVDPAGIAAAHPDDRDRLASPARVADRRGARSAVPASTGAEERRPGSARSDGRRPRVGRRRRPVAPASRLRSSTAVSESRPRSLKVRPRSIAPGESWPSTSATRRRTWVSATAVHSDSGTPARRSASEPPGAGAAPRPGVRRACATAAAASARGRGRGGWRCRGGRRR